LLEGRDVCLAQIRAGMAWHYKYYQNEQSAEDRQMYADVEEEARMSKRGLWVDADPTPPWEFRRSGNK
jgi:endonuclease YncB( thermonuclease family)